MNREIKFRVWDTIGKEWFDSEYWKITGSGTVENYTTGEENDETLILEQFTGLLDKNGKEIYEGDIVTALSSDNKYLSLVKWDDRDGRWGFESILSKNMSYSYNLTYGCSKWEIVGNIHENPQLLRP